MLIWRWPILKVYRQRSQCGWYCLLDRRYLILWSILIPHAASVYCLLEYLWKCLIFFFNHFMVMRSVRTWIRIIGWFLVSNEILNNFWLATVAANIALFSKTDANVLRGWFTIFTTIVFRIDGDFVHARSGHAFGCVDFSDTNAASYRPVVTHSSAIWFNE